MTQITASHYISTAGAEFSSIINVQGGIQLNDATKVVVNSGSNILYQVTTGGAHIMETQSGTDLLKADSTRGTGTRVSGMEALWGGGTLLYQKLIRGVSPTGNATVAYAHGITDGKNIGLCNMA